MVDIPDNSDNSDDAAAPALKLTGAQDVSLVTDESLMLAHRTGDPDAFEVLVRRYRPELFPFLIRFMSGRAAAEDVFQDTFLQIHLSADKFDVTKRFKPWLYTIASNKARDLLRKQKRRKTVPLSAGVGRDGDGPAFVDLMDSGLPRPLDIAEDRDMAQRVRGVVEQLPDHLREVLLLAYFQQFAYREVAEMLGIPLGTVKSRLHSAVGTFAQYWKKSMGGADDDDPSDGPSDESGKGG
ncbi:MAG: RNA polymerase sigma factor [Algisphaera sp.]